MTVTKLLHRVLCVLFILASGAVYLVAHAPAGRRSAYGIVLHLLLALIMFGAWATSRSATADEHRWTLVAGFLARLLVFPVGISLGHDGQRYLWDGAVFWAGLDPYTLPPSASALADLRAVWSTPAEHMAYTTIYPPGAIALFGLAASAGPTWALRIWKLLVTVASVGTLCAGAKLLQERSLARHLPLVAFSPLLVMETATGAHLDVISALAVAVALFLVHRRRFGAAGMALGAGVLLKFLPGVALLPLAVSLGRRSAIRLLAGAAVVVVAGYGIAFQLGLRPLGSLFVFFERWRFGSPIFTALSAIFGDAWAQRIAPCLLVVALLVIVRLACRHSWVTLVPPALAVPLLASPVVFPWYLASLVPALALAPSAFLLAWLTAIPLTYEVIDRFDTLGAWEPASWHWPLWAIGFAWVLGLTIDMAVKRRSRKCEVLAEE
ncbi:MAG: glycosyltransferase 87 family protein [Acidobacteriota bacterium]